jgi:hypothetical protein
MIDSTGELVFKGSVLERRESVCKSRYTNRPMHEVKEEVDKLDPSKSSYVLLEDVSFVRVAIPSLWGWVAYL